MDSFIRNRNIIFHFLFFFCIKCKNSVLKYFQLTHSNKKKTVRDAFQSVSGMHSFIHSSSPLNVSKVMSFRVFLFYILLRCLYCFVIEKKKRKKKTFEDVWSARVFRNFCYLCHYPWKKHHSYSLLFFSPFSDAYAGWEWTKKTEFLFKSMSFCV